MKALKLIILLLLLGFFTLNIYSCSGGGGDGIGNIPDFSLSWSIGSGDVNNDGLTDVVIGHSGSGSLQHTISIFFQDPLKPGSFTRYVRTVTYSPWGIKIVDLNADNRSDIILIVGATISVYLQDSVVDGSFLTETIYSMPSGSSRNQLTFGDLNGDGRVDIAAVNGNGVSIFFQDPANAGSFFQNVTILENIGVTSLAIEDLNGDGLDDIVVARYTQNKISIYTQDPSSMGTFIFAGDYVTAYAPDYIIAGDLNGDNEPDIAVSNGNFISIYMQDVSKPGTFLSPSDISVNAHPSKIDLADLNKDGLNDIAAIGTSANAMAIILQGALSPGTFLPATIYSPRSPFDITIGDFNNDSNLDIGVACADIDYVFFQDPANPGKYLIPAYVIENQ